MDVFVQMGHNYNGRKLAVYTSDLEKYIIENAGAYYQRKSREWMDNDSMPIYLEKAGTTSGSAGGAQTLSCSAVRATTHASVFVCVAPLFSSCCARRWRRCWPPKLPACLPT